MNATLLGPPQEVSGKLSDVHSLFVQCHPRNNIYLCPLSPFFAQMNWSSPGSPEPEKGILHENVYPCLEANPFKILSALNSVDGAQF